MKLTKTSKVLALAGFSLGLDIAALIAVFVMLSSASNIWFIVFLGIIIYILAWDATQAVKFLVEHFR